MSYQKDVLPPQLSYTYAHQLGSLLCFAHVGFRKLKVIENSSHQSDGSPFLIIKNLKIGGSVYWRGSTEIQMQVSLHSTDCIETNICLNLKIHRFLLENNYQNQSYQSDSLQIDRCQYQFLCKNSPDTHLNILQKSIRTVKHYILTEEAYRKPKHYLSLYGSMDSEQTRIYIRILFLASPSFSQLIHVIYSQEKFESIVNLAFPPLQSACKGDNLIRRNSSLTVPL